MHIGRSLKKWTTGKRWRKLATGSFRKSTYSHIGKKISHQAKKLFRGLRGSGSGVVGLPTSYDVNSAYQYRGKTLSQLIGGV